MSYNDDEFHALIKAYREKRLDDLHSMLQQYDPESIKAAEGYLGVKFSHSSGAIRCGLGQGKMKKYSKPHSKKWYDKKIKQAKNKEEKQLWKAAKSARLRELNITKKQIKFQKTKTRIKIKKIKHLDKLIKNRESLKRQIRRYGIKIPRQANLPNKKYKYIGARTKVIMKSNKALKQLIKSKKTKH